MGWASEYIKQLEAGETVKFRPQGSSMWPLIEPGHLCTVEPVNRNNQPVVGDVVLCKVKGQEYLHLVKTLRSGYAEIANNSGFVNGWTPLEQIYGRLIQIEP